MVLILAFGQMLMLAHHLDRILRVWVRRRWRLRLWWKTFTTDSPSHPLPYHWCDLPIILVDDDDDFLIIITRSDE